MFTSARTRLLFMSLTILSSSGCGMLRAYQDPADVQGTAQACDCRVLMDHPGIFASRQEIEEIQARLILLGYPVGGIDGMFGENTRSAIRSYQADHKLLTDGRPSPELLKHIIESAVDGTTGL